MIEIRYKRILFFQAIFLIILGVITFVILQNNLNFLTYFSIWTTAILLNLFCILRFALPSKSLLEQIREGEPSSDLSWAEIEESIVKKDFAFNKQKKEFELENFKYKQLLDSQEDAVCILTKELLIVYANHSFSTLFSFKESNLPLPLIEITRNLEFKDFLVNATHTEHTSRKSYFTFNQLHVANKAYFDIKIFQVKDSNNYLCLLHDVTERKMADQMREDFVSNFSHEVRTPLTILNGQMQNLKENLQLDDQFEARFSQIFLKIENNSRRLINLFNDLLRLTSVETKKEINKELIDIEEMLLFLTQDLQLNYPQKKIVFDIALSQKTFLVDYNLFEQVLLNLIDNSLKYIEHTGVISIRSFKDEKWDHLIIKDSGVGIPEDQIIRIFERFFRVDTSRSSQIEGTGLGLSIVKHIVLKHDGKIKAHSAPQDGTTFTLSFPV